MVIEFKIRFKTQNFSCLFSKTSIVVAADESIVSWGPSPTNGELVSNEIGLIIFSLNIFSVHSTICRAQPHFPPSLPPSISPSVPSFLPPSFHLSIHPFISPFPSLILHPSIHSCFPTLSLIHLSFFTNNLFYLLPLLLPGLWAEERRFQIIHKPKDRRTPRGYIHPYRNVWIGTYPIYCQR